MTQDILISISVGCLIVILILMIVLFFYNRNSRNKMKGYGEMQTKKRLSFDVFFQKGYIFFSRNPITSRYVNDIRIRIEISSDYGEAGIRKRVMQIFFMALFIIIGLFITFLLFTRELYLILLFCLFMSFAAETIVDFFVIRAKNRLLYQQIEFNNRIRHQYYQCKMVDEAMYDACQDTDKKRSYEIAMQGERIYDILMSSDVEGELVKYYDTAPNKFLKMLAGISYIVREYGDAIIDDMSLFMKCLGYLNTELKVEVLKRDRLNYALKSLNIIVLLPLFFMQPLKNWAAGNFLPMQAFYDSKAGFILEILMILLVIFCYMMIRRVQQFDDGIINKQGRKGPDEKAYQMYLNRIIDKIAPKPFTKKHRQKEKLLKDALSPIKIHLLYTRKVIIGISLFAFCLFVIFMSHRIAVKNILYNPTIPEGFLGGQLSGEEMDRAREITDFDRMIISKTSGNMEADEIRKLVIDEGDFNDAASKIAAERIYIKMTSLDKQYFKWWELVISLVLFLFGYHIPELMLRVQSTIRKVDMEDEVSQFQTIVMMLMHIKRLSVEDILEWMELFSFVFKEPLQKCLSNYDAGAWEALEELKHDVSFPAFQKIVDNLQLAVEDLSIEQAFDELESEKTYYQEVRKETNERIIKRKQGIGQMIGFTPIYALLLLYLVIPMLVSSFREMSVYFENIQ